MKGSYRSGAATHGRLLSTPSRRKYIGWRTNKSLGYWRQIYDNTKMPSRVYLPMKPHRLLICLIPMFCAGCGLMPRTGEPSLALHIADEMGIPASDLSRQA